MRGFARPAEPSPQRHTRPVLGQVNFPQLDDPGFHCLLQWMGRGIHTRPASPVESGRARGPARKLGGIGAFAGSIRARRIIALGVLTAICAAVATATFIGADLPHGGVADIQSFLALMGQRSPGTRTADELTKTKSAPAAAPDDANVATPSIPMPGGAVPPPLRGPVVLSLNAAPLTQLPLLGGLAPPPFATADLPPPPLGGSLPPPACCGGTGPTPPGLPGAPPPPGPPGDPGAPPVSAVPEPGAWALMLLGFAIIGSSARRQRIRRALEVAHP
jgi:hypothetical protein